MNKTQAVILNYFLPAALIIIVAASAPTFVVAQQESHAKRQWTSRDGEFTIQAEFVKQDETHVWLRRENGKTIRVAKTDLSEKDRRRLDEIAGDRSQSESSSKSDETPAKDQNATKADSKTLSVESIVNQLKVDVPKLDRFQSMALVNMILSALIDSGNSDLAFSFAEGFNEKGAKQIVQEMQFQYFLRQKSFKKAKSLLTELPETTRLMSQVELAAEIVKHGSFDEGFKQLAELVKQDSLVELRLLGLAGELQDMNKKTEADKLVSLADEKSQNNIRMMLRIRGQNKSPTATKENRRVVASFFAKRYFTDRWFDSVEDKKWFIEVVEGMVDVNQNRKQEALAHFDRAAAESVSDSLLLRTNHQSMVAIGYATIGRNDKASKILADFGNRPGKYLCDPDALFFTDLLAYACVRSDCFSLDDMKGALAKAKSNQVGTVWIQGAAAALAESGRKDEMNELLKLYPDRLYRTHVNAGILVGLLTVQSNKKKTKN